MLDLETDAELGSFHSPVPLPTCRNHRCQTKKWGGLLQTITLKTEYPPGNEHILSGEVWKIIFKYAENQGDRLIPWRVDVCKDFSAIQTEKVRYWSSDGAAAGYLMVSYWRGFWMVLVLSTHLKKYKSPWESSPIFGVNIKHIWNHHLVLDGFWHMGCNSMNSPLSMTSKNIGYNYNLSKPQGPAFKYFTCISTPVS